MAAQDEHKALSDLNEMLRRHNDILRVNMTGNNIHTIRWSSSGRKLQGNTL